MARRDPLNPAADPDRVLVSPTLGEIIAEPRRFEQPYRNGNVPQQVQST
jgi:hypothetical protein